MLNNSDIVIKDTIITNDRIKYTLEVPRRLRRYFISPSFEVQYDAEITCDDSIGNIPIVSTIMPLAWLNGVNICVKSIDVDYYNGIEKIKEDYRILYPKGSFNSRLIADEQIDNSRNPLLNKYALLFSGGVDSTYSLAFNYDLTPELIMIFGADMALSNLEEIEKVKRWYSNFAYENDLDIHFITTNARENIDMWRITHDFHGVLGSHYWGRIAVGLFHAGHTAPLSMGRFDHLIVAASNFVRRDLDDPLQNPHGSIPVIDEKITWANVNIKHDGVMHRQDKILPLVEFSRNHSVKLKVCLERVSENCNACHKCLRSIFSLLVVGEDPNDYGFNVGQATLEFMKAKLMDGSLSGDIDWYWRRMQSDMPDDVDEVVPGLGEFCSWLRSFDLNNAKRDAVGDWRHWMYYNAPFEMGNLFYNPDKKRSAQRL